MKTLFIQGKFKPKIIVPRIKIKEKVLGLITTIQFLHQLKDIEKQLKNQKFKTISGGQILGCRTEAAKKIENRIQALLYIGSGKFHPLSIALSLKKDKPIYIFNPLTREFSKLGLQEINKVKAKRKTAKLKFLSAQKLGILVSTKPGQNHIKEAEKIKQKLKKQGKKVYIFIFNDFDINQLENFREIECWINTACPGFSLENPFIWYKDIK